jgi:O-antigen/teichoic acid export membrane protein
MENQIKKLLNHSFIFSLADFLKGAIGFLLIPIYTRYLTPVDYGKLELLNVTLSILAVLVHQGIGTAFFRSFASCEDEKKISVVNLVSTSYFYMAISALFIGVLLYFSSGKYSQFLFGEGSSSGVFVKIIAVTLFFQTLNMIPFQLMRAHMESLKYVSLSLSGFLIQLILNITFIVMLKLGIIGILLANVITSFLLAVMTMLVIKKHLIFNISKPLLKELLSFGYPLILAGLSLWVLQMSDRFLIQKLASTEEVGLYSLGFRFSNILTLLIIMPFQAVWGAYSFQIAVKDGGKTVIRTIATYFLLIMCFFGLLIILWSPVAIKFMTGKNFWEAHKVVLPLVYKSICWGLLVIFIFGLYFSKKTKHLSGIVCIGATVDIILNFILIPKYGMMGAAFSALIAYIIMNILSYKMSQRNYFIPFDKVRFFKIAIIFIIFTVPSVIFHFHNVAGDIIFRILLMMCFMSSFYLIKFFNDEEINFVKNKIYHLKEHHGIFNKIRFTYEMMRR